jgi:serine/threonine protein kinase
VYIKEVRTRDLESSIALMLSAIDNPANHSVPILDTFEDPLDKSISYLVMPFLRLTDSPPFEVVEEVLDFADQILEVRSEHELKLCSLLTHGQGLVFMHSHGVAHRFCLFTLLPD